MRPGFSRFKRTFLSVLSNTPLATKRKTHKMVGYNLSPTFLCRKNRDSKNKKDMFQKIYIKKKYIRKISKKICFKSSNKPQIIQKYGSLKNIILSLSNKDESLSSL